ncbi:MAG: hypothetical protein JWR00_2825 [Rubritepida sp.]|nr:hypothetical protein [Rubritepida sp.]
MEASRSLSQVNRPLTKPVVEKSEAPPRWIPNGGGKRPVQMPQKSSTVGKIATQQQLSVALPRKTIAGVLAPMPVLAGVEHLTHDHRHRASVSPGVDAVYLRGAMISRGAKKCSRAHNTAWNKSFFAAHRAKHGFDAWRRDRDRTRPAADPTHSENAVSEGMPSFIPMMLRA